MIDEAIVKQGGTRLAKEIGELHGRAMQHLREHLGDKRFSTWSQWAQSALIAFSHTGVINEHEARAIGRIFDAVEQRGGGDYKARVRKVCDEILADDRASLITKAMAAIGLDSIKHTDEETVMADLGGALLTAPFWVAGPMAWLTGAAVGGLCSYGERNWGWFAPRPR